MIYNLKSCRWCTQGKNLCKVQWKSWLIQMLQVSIESDKDQIVLIENSENIWLHGEF